MSVFHLFFRCFTLFQFLCFLKWINLKSSFSCDPLSLWSTEDVWDASSASSCLYLTFLCNMMEEHVFVCIGSGSSCRLLQLLWLQVESWRWRVTGSLMNRPAASHCNCVTYHITVASVSLRCVLVVTWEALRESNYTPVWPHFLLRLS